MGNPGRDTAGNFAAIDPGSRGFPGGRLAPFGAHVVVGALVAYRGGSHGSHFAVAIHSYANSCYCPH
jgi:hypothetical protein